MSWVLNPVDSEADVSLVNLLGAHGCKDRETFVFQSGESNAVLKVDDLTHSAVQQARQVNSIPAPS